MCQDNIKNYPIARSRVNTPGAAGMLAALLPSAAKPAGFLSLYEPQGDDTLCISSLQATSWHWVANILS